MDTCLQVSVAQLDAALRDAELAYGAAVGAVRVDVDLAG
jgi:hypothetical protein